MLESGRILQDRYRIERQIGQGGMGSVYLATDQRFNSTVAIKETVIADDNFRKALKREARLLNSLKHVALPKVSDHFIEDNGQYIVMEYISGEDLHEMMERSGQAFPVEDVMIWAEQLLDALEYLHGQENPIIHRDIKPQNLKLTPQGQIILLDFGLAKGNPTDANHKTAANSIFGYSRHYASLEQIQGTGTDPRSDIYSLAATLYHLLTGKAPADALTRVMNVMNEDPDPLQPANLVHEQVDEELAGALSQCLSLNANLRPQSAGEMFQVLFSEEKTVVTQKTKASESFQGISGLSTQNTKILPDGEAGEASEMRTEVMDPFGYEASAATRIASPDTDPKAGKRTALGGGVTNSGFRRKRVAAAVGAFVFLLVGTGIAMLYIDGISSGPVEGEFPAAKMGVPEPSAEESSPETAEVPVETMDTQAVESVADPGSGQSAAGQSVSGSSDTTTAAGRRSSVTVSDLPPGMDPEELKELEKELGAEFDFTVKNGKIFTEGAIVDKDGVVLQPLRPGQAPIRIPISREELQGMTPAQRRKLRNALEQRRIAEEQVKEQMKRLGTPVPVSPPPPPPPKDNPPM